MTTKNMASILLSAILLALVAYGSWVFLAGWMGGGGRAGFIETSGRIEGREHHAASKIAGRVDEIYVEEGGEIEAGQKVALIDSPQLNATLDQANAHLRKAEANFKLTQRDHERYSRLLKEEAIPRAEYEQVENRWMLAKEEAIAARKEVDKLKADLEDTKIKAPIKGTVVTKIVQPGEVIVAGTPVVSLVNMDDLYLKVFLTTDKVGKVGVGDEARVHPDAFPDQAFEAVVEKISEKAEFTPKNVETKSQRAKLVFEIKLKIKENKDHKLKPGMPAEALIKIDKKAVWKK
ncbi:MAG: efflux RND transporter periplasmic adaptor subunit [Candidatus Omnitrophica bacterium]|nr:efflux RND transporter periplasmic adaptor subunit [Candidatus Omnitrophota bacterium]